MPKADLLICGLGVAMYQLTFFSAVQITGIAISTVTALGSVPTFSAIVAFVILGEKPQKSWYLGTSVTILGIVLVGTANGVDEFNPLGILLAAVAGFGFAVFSVVSRKSLSRGAQDIWLTASSFGVAAALTAPFLFAQNPVWMTTTEGALSVLWLGLVPTAIGYFLFTYGLKRIDSSTAATVVLAEPATATNNDNSGDQHTDCHTFASAAARAVQVIPFGDVMTRFVPFHPTATNKDNCGDQHTDIH
jgi:DME family drug/metabolite transporter